LLFIFLLALFKAKLEEENVFLSETNDKRAKLRVK